MAVSVGFSLVHMAGSVRFCPVQIAGPAGRDCSTSDHRHPSFEKVFTLRPEVVDMRLEMQFEDVIFMDVFRLAGMCY